MSQPFMITKIEGRITALQRSGHVDGQAEPSVIESAHRAQAAGARFILADVSRVEMVSSAGRRALHVIYKMFMPQDEMETWQKEHAGDIYKSPYFKIAGPSPQVHYVLSIAGFLQNIPLYSSVQDALESFK